MAAHRVVLLFLGVLATWWKIVALGPGRSKNDVRLVLCDVMAQRKRFDGLRVPV